MGIEKFSKTFEPEINEITLIKAIKNKNICVDGNSAIHRAMKGMGHIQALTNKKGESTQHINVILSNTISMICNAKSVIWVFDTKASVLKQNEIERRKQLASKAKEKITNIQKEIDYINENLEEVKIVDPEYNDTLKQHKKNIDKLKIQTFKLDKKVINDTKFILEKLGVSWIDAPKGYEAEQISGVLSKRGEIDICVTNDFDALLFGNSQILAKINKRAGKYALWSINYCLESKKINSLDELIWIGLALGSDFDKKGIPRIGPKTVIKKVQSGAIKWNDDFKVYFNYFKKEIDVPIKTNVVPKITNQSIKDLIDWLVNEQSFKRERIEKLLDKLKI